MGPDVPDHPLTTPPAARRYGILEVLLAAILLALFARTFVVQAFRVPTASMEPDLLVGDHVLVNKFVFGPSAWPWERRWLPLRQPRRGDVLVFRYPVDPRRKFVKRCVGVPGDRVRLRERRLLVNGRPVAEPYVRFTDPQAYPDSPFLDEYYRRRDNFGPLMLPPGQYFCLGDNRDLSDDSRFWGSVPREAVRGRPLLVYGSLRPLGHEEASAPLGRLAWWRQQIDRVRWRRFLRVVR